ncbi:MAG: sigma-54 dependent transcriptional regulator [Sandaracinaceae bacterium]|nr:sigma-54 dependent transcriptional regulator [Sandaracinaceae bacterium]
MSDAETLDRFERLRGVQVARAILKDAFGLELVLVTASGPIAHARGGVMVGSSEVCRTALFSRDGFTRCDAHYRALGASEGEHVGTCHLGLGCLSVPARTPEGVLHVVASGFSATSLEGAPPVDPRALAHALVALDPTLRDASDAVRKLPIVKGDRVATVRTILRIAAQEIANEAEDELRRLTPREPGVVGRGQGARPIVAAREDVAAPSLPGLFGLVGASPRMRTVFDLVRKVAASDANVLIVGESGTGKELVARAIHEHGGRHGKPFVAQSCAAMSEEILESTLFGHVRGAFSGAIRASEGLFGAARGGTLFLDEVAEMPLPMQAKLLRVLSDGTYLPVGAVHAKRTDVRLLAATHRDLGQMVGRGEFRQDLFYRLHVLAIELPPLRERTGDLKLLLEQIVAQTPNVPTRISATAMRCIDKHSWPGNVRELRAEVERWAITAQGAPEVGPEHLSQPIREAGGYGGGAEDAAIHAASSGSGTLEAAIESLERALLERGLERTRGNRTQLARELAISRTTLLERLKRFGLERPE